jgi:hypothetical protein
MDHGPVHADLISLALLLLVTPAPVSRWPADVADLVARLAAQLGLALLVESDRSRTQRGLQCLRIRGLTEHLSDPCFWKALAKARERQDTR